MPIESWGKSGVLAYFGPKISHFGHIFWNMDVKFDHFSVQNYKKGHMSKSHFAQVSITLKPSPKFFHEFVWNF